MSTDRIKHKENLIYIILWMIVLIFYMLHLWSEHADESQPLFSLHDIATTCKDLLPLLALFIANNYIFIPRLLMRGLMWQYALSIVLAIGVTFLFQYSFYHPSLPPFPDLMSEFGMPTPPPRHHSVMPIPLINDIIYSILVIGINLAVSMQARYIIMSLEKERIQAANTTSQLNHLKAQINPHFYMNMLNNIHGLIDIDPERAKDMVFDMSRLMQYMLYDSSRPTISLVVEIKFLQDYIRLMRQRYPENKVQVRENYPQHKSIEGIKIPPLLFLVFVENAFKHGIDYRHQSFVTVSLEVSDQTVHFTCINSLHHTQTSPTDPPGGVGLENITKRLELLYGKNHVGIDINKTDDTYIVNLSLPLHENQDTDN